MSFPLQAAAILNLYRRVMRETVVELRWFIPTTRPRLAPVRFSARLIEGLHLEAHRDGG
jgi:hypothetical protein